MPLPLIGLSTGWTTRELSEHPLESNRYANAVSKCGGEPVFLPIGISPRHLEERISKCAGILLRGGGDMDPTRYGVIPSRLTNLKEVNPERDALEISLVLRAIESRKPLLGICRGIQVMNVALGGSLYQDIQAELKGSFNHDHHFEKDGSKKPRDFFAHSVTLAPESLLSNAIGKTSLKVNSLHHQGLKDVSPRFNVTGTVPEDGLVEAIELKDHPFFVGVQWHPEELSEYPDHLAIFRAFINQAVQYEKKT